ncbi:hypothetical protein ACQ4PT_013858 [Festuca glaucescens]
MFAFCSLGVKVDDSINTGWGPYVFRVNGFPCHRIGSLVPTPNKSPKFAQLYIYDTVNEVDHRMAVFGVEGGDGGAADRQTAVDLTAMLNSCNELVKKFRMIQVSRERIELAVQPFSIRIVGSDSADPRVYSPPTAPELAALIVGDLDTERCKFDIVVEPTDGPLKRISPLHPALMALQKGETNPYLCCGRLSQQACVDAYACVESSRLSFILKNQDKLRSETYQGISDAVGQGSASGRSVGVRVLLPSGFIGSRRYMAQNYQDAMAICRCYGAPDLFVTFTCNPKWDEIADALRFEPGQIAADRPDIVSRVFKMKLDALYAEVKNGTAFGPTRGALYTVEFQKRGLPHAHILIWLDHRRGRPDQRPDELPRDASPEFINDIVSAELPDPVVDPLAYVLVDEFMVHGPCGRMNMKCPCMRDGVCSKRFPKAFSEETSVDQSGYPVYRRRPDGRFVVKDGHSLDNRWAHNVTLLKRYQAHINVEWCNKTNLVKYLFKYITKGPDRANVAVHPLGVPPGGQDDGQGVDEVTEYISCRYLSACEAFWRLYSFDIHVRAPAVERFEIHMPGMNRVTYAEDADLGDIVQNDNYRRSTLTEWFAMNRLHPECRELTYCEFPTKYTWYSDGRRWVRRGHGFMLGRIRHVSPSTGELFYMRMLLMVVRGAQSFEDLRCHADLADLIKQTSLVLWDEAPISHRGCVESLDRTLRDVLSEDHPGNAGLPFGGLPVVMGGDFRQVLPVIPRATRAEIVNATLSSSSLWSHVKVVCLTENMRLSADGLADDERAELSKFSDWVLAVGDDGDRVDALIDSVYDDFTAFHAILEYLAARAIVCPTNVVVNAINDRITAKVQSEGREYFSADRVAPGSEQIPNVDVLYTTDILNAITQPNYPDHRLLLKVGMHVILLRNLNQAMGLCNGTRLLITRLADYVFEATVMTGLAVGQSVCIPKIVLNATNPEWPFVFQWRQFPVRVCYAVTINKSHGQTLKKVGLYLQSPVFTHGQLYVAVSRVTSPEGLRVLIAEEDGSCGFETRNIVYREVLDVVRQ